MVHICKRLCEWHFYEVQNKFYLLSFRNFIMAVHVHLYTFTLHTTWTTSLSKCALTANLLLHTRNESCSMLPHLFLRFSTVFSCTDDGTDCDYFQKHCCQKNDKDSSVADFFISSIDKNEKKGPLEEKYCSMVVLGWQKLRSALQAKLWPSARTF